MTGLPSAKKALFYSLAFGPPKAGHPLIAGNWQQLEGVADFLVVTDKLEDWKKIFVNAKNVHLKEMCVDDFFALAYPYFKVADKAQFMQKYSSCFFDLMNGWTACGLRPLLRKMIPPQTAPDFWGWIDYDVMCDRGFLVRVLQSKAKALYFSSKGMAWEQVKLFAYDQDIEAVFFEVLKAPKKDVPLEASTVSRLAGMDLIKDNCTQKQIAVHWAYSDKLGQLENQFDVTVKSDGSLYDDKGSPLACFVADTQVKTFTPDDLHRVQSAWAAGQPFVFVYNRIKA